MGLIDIGAALAAPVAELEIELACSSRCLIAGFDS